MKFAHLSMGLIAAGLLMTSCVQGGSTGTGALIASANQLNTLSISKTNFTPGEAIAVTFHTEQLPKTAWVGVIPSSVPHGSEAKNDAADLSYKYLGGASTGTLMMQAPEEPGSYDLRLNESDGGGRELTSVSFVVKGDPATGTGFKMSLSKTVYKPGEQLSGGFEVTPAIAKKAWVGMVKSDVPKGTGKELDKVDMATLYLNGQSIGPIKLWTPKEPGSYDLRLTENGDDGKELTRVTFTVQPE